MSVTPEPHADGALLLTPSPVARLTLNTPRRRNAMTRAMWQALPAICDRVAADPGIRVLVVHGAGDAAFSAGADISEFTQVYATPDSTRAYNAEVRAAQAALRDLPRPVIAEVRGACFGGGCGLALACDLRFAGASARFAITPAKLGLSYSPEDTWQLIEKVGPARSRDMLFSGRALDATEALAIGLVDRLCPDDVLDPAVAEYAGRLADLAPGALATVKATINALTAPPNDPGGRVQALFDARFSSAEFAEGTRAFLEKRPPRY